MGVEDSERALSTSANSAPVGIETAPPEAPAVSRVARKPAGWVQKQRHQAAAYKLKEEGKR